MLLRKPQGGLKCRIFRKRRLWIRLFGSIFVISLVCLSVDIIMSRENAFYNPPAGQFNYFLEADEHAKMGYMVDTKHCRILNISAWHKSVLPFISHESQTTNCKENRQWTFVQNENLIVNKTALKESGYTWSSISCCYRAIIRVNQSLEKYDSEADRQVIYPDECKPMGLVTRLENEFIRVFCKSKYWPLSMDVIYRYFHAIPLPHRSSKSQNKINYWESQRKTQTLNKEGKSPKFRQKFRRDSEYLSKAQTPPNVVMIGIDSMSRLSFQRNMPKTRDFLKNIGAVEMLGYTKLGENTFPNAVAFSTGYQVDELPKVCNYSMSTPLDYCPFIWKEFNEANYLTAFIEDVPLLATFNHYKTGFVEQPVDFYFRPFMLGVHYHAPSMHYYTIDCIGRQTVDETIHKYVEDILKISSSKNVPSFIYTWITNLAHVDLNAAQFADDSYLNFLQRIDLSNTFIFFMSDHGYRYGQIRQTFAGWYEDKLPNFWAYIPPRIREEFPDWSTSLEINSRRLSSPMDLHHTLAQILKTFKPNQHPDRKGPKPSNIAKKFGQSMFKLIPESRRCKDAGVSENFCACVAPRRLETNNTQLHKSAQSAIKSINKILPRECLPLTLHTVVAGGVMDKTLDDDSKALTYITAFDTTPGGFLFEASIDYFPGNKSYKVIGDLLRMNKINTDVSCVKDDFLEKICYCSSDEVPYN